MDGPAGGRGSTGYRPCRGRTALAAAAERASTGTADEADTIRGRMSQHEIDATVSATTDMMTVLRHTGPADKAERQTRLGRRLTHNRDPRMLSARTKLRVIMHERPR